MGSVVGRESELEAVERLIAGGRSGFAGLVLEGEAGIGKTTVWREAVRTAELSGYTILRSRPAEAEARLAFASLADLLDPIDAERLSDLPEPQRHAIEVALLRTRPRLPLPDARALATGVLSLFGSLAEAPLLVAVDDAQWLDRSSAAALSFALRRMDPSSRLAIVVGLRAETGRERNPLALADAPGNVEHVRLGPLSLSALYHIIRAELGLVLPRPTLQRIAQASGGNPLFALELARALAEHGGRPGPGEPLPIPGELSALLESRIRRLPARSRDALLATALLSTPTTHLIERALGGSSREALERSLRADVIELREERIRFRHPLLAGAVASSFVPAKRRAMHRRLAEVVKSTEQRARHLALAADGPDEAVAKSLEEAAELAADRAAPEEAAELLELACRLTPTGEGDELARRHLALADAVHRAGDASEAVRLLDALLASGVAGPPRARALELRAQTHWVAGTAADAEACCNEALDHAGGDDRLRARALVTLARVTLDAGLLRERARAALEALDGLPDPDPSLLSEALVAVASAEFIPDRARAMGIVERGLELERTAASPNVADRMSGSLGVWLKADGDLEGARHWLELTRQTALDEGDEGSLPYVLGHLSQLELWTGHWDQAEAYAIEHLELAERTGQSLERLTAIHGLAFVRAHRGQVDEARTQIEHVMPEAEKGEPWNVYQLLSALGFAELSAGRFPEAVAALSRSWQIYEESGAGDTPPVFENYSEALAATGDLETAERVTDIYLRRARSAQRANALAPALRCRALIDAARQRLDNTLAALEEAMSAHERVDLPFSRARTLLVLGQVQRRRGERRAARDALEEALAVFDELGAPLWAKRARAELDRVPIRRGAASEGLTPTEERVAELVAEGHTNREVAQALFVSEKTVEANLTRIYRKLGVRSRTALAARLAALERGDDPAIP